MKKTFSFNDIFTQTIEFYKNHTTDFSWGVFKGSLFYLILMMAGSSYVLITDVLSKVFKVADKLTIALDPLLVEELLKIEAIQASFVSISSIQISLVSIVYWGLQISVFLLVPFAFLMLLFSLCVLLKKIAIYFEGSTIKLLNIKQDVWEKAAMLFWSLFSHISIFLLGLFLLLIPGFFFLVRFSFVYFVILFENKGMMESFKRSWALTQGIFWRLFVLKLIFIVLWIVLASPFFMGMILLDVPIAVRYLVYFLIFAFTIPLVLIFYYFLFLELKRQTDGGIKIQIRQTQT